MRNLSVSSPQRNLILNSTLNNRCTPSTIVNVSDVSTKPSSNTGSHGGASTTRKKPA